MGRRPEVSLEVQRLVQEKVFEGHGPTAIYYHLNTLEKSNPLLLGQHGRAPSKSSVDRLVRKFKPKDPSGPWMFLRASDRQRRLVPEVLSHVFFQTQGRVWLTNDMAELVTQVRESCPEIPLEWAYRFARIFQIAQNDPELEGMAILTFGQRPWGSGDHGWQEYEHWLETAVEYANWEDFAAEEKLPEDRGDLKDVEDPLTINTPSPPKAPRSRSN